MVVDITPDLDPSKLSLKKKIELVRQSDGLLIELLENEKIRRDLYLYECASLIHLPKGLKVGGNLSLTGCTSLTHLLDGLKVGGNLNLTGCTSLTHLLDGLKVGGPSQRKENQGSQGKNQMVINEGVHMKFIDINKLRQLIRAELKENPIDHFECDRCGVGINKDEETFVIGPNFYKAWCTKCSREKRNT